MQSPAQARRRAPAASCRQVGVQLCCRPGLQLNAWQQHRSRAASRWAERVGPVVVALARVVEVPARGAVRPAACAAEPHASAEPQRLLEPDQARTLASVT
eukprot:scaffold46073_cov33-Tisochrysis_lutea.AAC.2